MYAKGKGARLNPVGALPGPWPAYFVDFHRAGDDVNAIDVQPRPNENQQYYA